MKIKNILFSGILLFTYGIAGRQTALGSQGHEETGPKDKSQKDADHHEDGIVALDPEQLDQLKLGSHVVRRGALQDTSEYPVVIKFDPNRVAHLSPRVSGVVREVRFGVGDQVKKGLILAVLESRELGMAKSLYLATLARQGLGEKTYAREKRLWEKKISAEQDYLIAEKELQETRIEARMAKGALLAMGVSETVIQALEQNTSHSFTNYQMAAPFDGVITEQHITLGELLKDSSKAFVVVDPKTVWAMAQIFERDIRDIKKGLKASVSINALPGQTFEGEIDYVASHLDEETRTVAARVVLANPEGILRAGMFGKMTLFFERSLKMSDSFLLPRAAMQRTKNGYVVFKRIGEGRFEQKTVTLVAKGGDFAEVIGDLNLGDTLATGDLFILKSRAEKDALGGGHSH